MVGYSCRVVAAESSAQAGNEVRFTQSAPYASAAEVKRHLAYVDIPSTYEISQERFRVFVPATYSTNRSWGLLVWVSPSDEPNVPDSWIKELADQKLLFVAACQSGNERPPLERCRLALDATFHVCRKYPVDRQRIYVGGFSGGGRIASALGVGYADLFAGALCVCGVDFYEPVPAAAGGYYLANYRPIPSLLQRATQHGRYVLITGERDMNRDNTKSTVENGFKRAHFQAVSYLEVPSMKHALPDNNILRQALQLLDPPH